MNTNVIIKVAEPEDGHVISDILSSAFQEFKEKYTAGAYNATVISSEEAVLRMEKGICWIAYLNNKPVATVSGKITSGSFYIQGMGARPEARGYKIAYLLLQKIEEYAIENNCSALLLSSTPYLKKAIFLYDKFGFKIVNDGPYDLFKTPLFTMKKILE